MPGEAGLDLLYVDVAPVKEDFADRAAVLVHLVPDDRHLFAEDHLRQVLFRSLPESLLRFGRVYALKAYAVLLVVRIQDRDGVAVRDAHDLALYDQLDVIRLLRRAGQDTSQHERQKQSCIDFGFHGLLLPRMKGILESSVGSLLSSFRSIIAFLRRTVVSFGKPKVSEGGKGVSSGSRGVSKKVACGKSVEGVKPFSLGPES